MYRWGRRTTAAAYKIYGGNIDMADVLAAYLSFTKKELKELKKMPVKIMDIIIERKKYI